MRLTSTRIAMSLAASTLAGGVLVITAATAAADPPATSQSTVGHAVPSTDILPGDLRVWDLEKRWLTARLLPGDVRMWEILHPWRP